MRSRGAQRQRRGREQVREPVHLHFAVRLDALRERVLPEPGQADLCDARGFAGERGERGELGGRGPGGKGEKGASEAHSADGEREKKWCAAKNPGCCGKSATGFHVGALRALVAEEADLVDRRDGPRQASMAWLVLIIHVSFSRFSFYYTYICH